MKKKYILILADFLYPEVVGGSARFASDINDSLVDAGHHIVVISRNPAGDYSLGAHEFERYEVVRISDFKKVISLIRSNHWDCVISHHFLLGLLSWLVPSRTVKKYFFQGPCYQEHYAKGGGYIGTAVRYVLESITVFHQNEIFVLSDYMKQKLPFWAKPKTKIVGPLHREHFTVLPIHPTSSGGPLKLLTVRRLTPRTGVKELIELCSHLPDQVHLTVVGKGELLNEIQSNCPANILIVGFVDDCALHEYYEKADLFVLPSIELEGFGLVILESLHMGTPVLASSTSGGGAEYLSDISKNFIYNRTNSPDAFLNNCQAAIQDYKREDIRSALVSKLNLSSMAEFSTEI